MGQGGSSHSHPHKRRPHTLLIFLIPPALNSLKGAVEGEAVSTHFRPLFRRLSPCLPHPPAPQPLWRGGGGLQPPRCPQQLALGDLHPGGGGEALGTERKLLEGSGGRTVRCARAVPKVGCFSPPIATGPGVLNSAPPMLF